MEFNIRMKMNDATIGSTIWADLVREILKPTSFLNQVSFHWVSRSN